MAIIEPRNGSRTSRGGNFADALGGLGRVKIDDEYRLKTALEVLGMIEQYAPKTAPGRPLALERNDDELRELIVKADRGRKITKADRESLVLLSKWKLAVRNVEMYSCGNLILLLGCMNTLDAYDRYEESQRIRNFLSEKYGAELPGPPAPGVCSMWGEAWASRHSQQRDVLPMILRSAGELKVKPIRVVPEQKAEEDDGSF